MSARDFILGLAIGAVLLWLVLRNNPALLNVSTTSGSTGNGSGAGASGASAGGSGGGGCGYGCGGSQVPGAPLAPVVGYTLPLPSPRAWPREGFAA